MYYICIIILSSIQIIHTTAVVYIGPMPSSLQLLKSEIESYTYDIIFEWIWASPEYLLFLAGANLVIKEYSRHTIISTVSDDLLHERIFKESGSKDVGEAFFNIEMFFWDHVDIAAGISSTITNCIQKSSNRATAALLSYSQDISTHALTYTFGDRHDIGYVGYDNGANGLAIKWIVDNLTSFMKSSHVFLHIYGSVSKPKTCTYENFCIYHGPVDNLVLSDALAKLRWFIAPVFTAAGISTKIIRSLASGTPVITTPYGIDGMSTVNMPIISLQPERISTLLTSIYANKTIWQSLHEYTIPYIKDNYGTNRLTAEIQAILTLKGDQLQRPNSHSFTNQHQHRSDLIRKDERYTIQFDVTPHKNSSFYIIHGLIDSLRIHSNYTIIVSSTHKPNYYAGTPLVPDVYIRFKWPHDFTRPANCPVGICKFILYIPWEFGYVPKEWKRQLTTVDSIWVPSSYNARMFFTHNMVHMDKVYVVPHGINCIPNNTYAPKIRVRLREKLNITSNMTVYLYVGGVLPRKGLDILISAWRLAYNSTDNAVLLIKASYSHSADLTDRLKRSTHCSRIVLIKKWFSDIGQLYDLADVLVHPSKAEGFGLTPFEALAYGKVVIASDQGATNDFMSTEYSILVESKKEKCTVWPCKGRSLCLFPLKSSWSACKELESHPFWCVHDYDLYICIYISIYLYCLVVYLYMCVLYTFYMFCTCNIHAICVVYRLYTPHVYYILYSLVYLHINTVYRYSMDTAKLAIALMHAKSSMNKHQFNAGWGSRLICDNYSWKAISYVAMAGIRKIFGQSPFSRDNPWVSGFRTVKGSKVKQDRFPTILTDRYKINEDFYSLCQDIVHKRYKSTYSIFDYFHLA